MQRPFFTSAALPEHHASMLLVKFRPSVEIDGKSSHRASWVICSNSPRTLPSSAAIGRLHRSLFSTRFAKTVRPVAATEAWTALPVVEVSGSAGPWTSHLLRETGTRHRFVCPLSARLENTIE